MKLTLGTKGTKSATAKASFGGGEKRAERIERMKKFWADKTNAVLYLVGNILANVEDVKKDSRIIGARILAGETIQVTEIGPFTGLDIKLSMGTASAWTCEACHSAHGSGIAPSREQDASAFASNRFYFNPATKRLFTLSDTCLGTYVKALGALTDDRFQPLPATLPAVKPVKA